MISLITAAFGIFSSSLSHTPFGPLIVVQRSIEADTRGGNTEACNANINLSSSLLMAADFKYCSHWRRHE